MFGCFDIERCRMGRFDIGKKYNKDCPVSWHSLYMDLVNEFEGTHPGEFIDEDTRRDKFSNSDGSGLVDKLKSVLDFDISSIAGMYNAERFYMFRVLKLLFYIESISKASGTVLAKNNFSVYCLQAFRLHKIECQSNSPIPGRAVKPPAPLFLQGQGSLSRPSSCSPFLPAPDRFVGTRQRQH